MSGNYKVSGRDIRSEEDLLLHGPAWFTGTYDGTIVWKECHATGRRESMMDTREVDI